MALIIQYRTTSMSIQHQIGINVLSSNINHFSWVCNLFFYLYNHMQINHFTCFFTREKCMLPEEQCSQMDVIRFLVVTQ